MRSASAKTPGTELLLLSLRMQCLSEASRTPVKTFFRYVTVFYEHGCMRSTTDPDNPDEVTLSAACAEEVFKVFTADPFSIEKCLYGTFAVAGDTASKNQRLEQDF